MFRDPRIAVAERERNLKALVILLFGLMLGFGVWWAAGADERHDRQQQQEMLCRLDPSMKGCK